MTTSTMATRSCMECHCSRLTKATTTTRNNSSKGSNTSSHSLLVFRPQVVLVAHEAADLLRGLTLSLVEAAGDGAAAETATSIDTQPKRLAQRPVGAGAASEDEGVCAATVTYSVT